jgi:hypothetical protein
MTGADAIHEVMPNAFRDLFHLIDSQLQLISSYRIPSISNADRFETSRPLSCH